MSCTRECAERHHGRDNFGREGLLPTHLDRRQAGARGTLLTARPGQTLIVPAVISLILFLACSYILIPLWREYRNRYSQYLPLDTISTHTQSFRARLQNAIVKWIIPARWRMDLRERFITDASSDAGFDSEDGEELDDVTEDRRHALSLDTSGRLEQTDSMRRLSREYALLDKNGQTTDRTKLTGCYSLEEGFMDDTDDESDDQQRRR